MKHTSVSMGSPVEIVKLDPLKQSPLISKCVIKVCYVDEKPNRKGTVITKDVALEMAQSLPGAMIVGYYDEAKDDFDGHSRAIDISNGKLEIKDITKPYGFVDLNAKVWFEKFLDDGKDEREYLMTEGYLWTGQYPECQRVIEKGNNQSMELSEKNLSGSWTKDDNGKPEFFIINEAIISKLCILGEDVEPCFEGATIEKEKIEFSFDEDFKNTLYSMMNEIKDLLKEGKAKMFTTYAVEIGDTLWSLIWNYLAETYPCEQKDCHCSKYRLIGIYEEGTQKFAVIQEHEDIKYFRLDFEYDDTNGFVPANELVEVTMTFVPEETPQFDPEAVAAFEATFAKEKEEPKEEEEQEEVCPECGKPLDECTCKKEEEKKQYNLEEIEEYTQLQKDFEELQNNFYALQKTNEEMTEQLNSLKEFKASVDRKEKEAMIEQFYMLSDEDKSDVIANIDTYSLDEIEAKLSVICVRNKVNLSLDENNTCGKPETTFNLGSEVDDMPGWVKAALETQNNIN